VAANVRIVAGLAAILVSLWVPSAGSADARGTMAPATQLQTALLDRVNALRTARGLARLRLSQPLTAAANAHSTEMARLGYFSHNSANGASFSSRIGRFYPLRGFHSWTVGENLLWGAPDIGAVRAFKLWLGSPPHRANLLSPRWREIGIVAMHSTKAPGLYGGRPATVVTADFGARSR
jgi:uncharacterized protein YkwD